MRTDEQIQELSKMHSHPVQFVNAINNEKIQELIEYHNNNEKIQKNTGAEISYVIENYKDKSNGILDEILEMLKIQFGNFNVRTAHYFDVSKPHILHIDDKFSYPKSYKAFTIPLQIRGTEDNKAKLVFFDQYYYDGPAKFLNGSDVSNVPIYYNEYITEYDRVFYKGDAGISPEHKKILSHLKDEWLEGLTVQRYFPWTIGSIIAFDSLQIHSASDFTSCGITSKLGLSIFTTID